MGEHLGTWVRVRESEGSGGLVCVLRKVMGADGYSQDLTQIPANSGAMCVDGAEAAWYMALESDRPGFKVWLCPLCDVGHMA